MFTGSKHELGKGENLLTDGIYGAEDPLKVRALGAVFQNQITTLWRRECVDSMSIATKA